MERETAVSDEAVAEAIARASPTVPASPSKATGPPAPRSTRSTGQVASVLSQVVSVLSAANVLWLHDDVVRPQTWTTDSVCLCVYSDSPALLGWMAKDDACISLYASCNHLHGSILHLPSSAKGAPCD